MIQVFFQNHLATLRSRCFRKSLRRNTQIVSRARASSEGQEQPFLSRLFLSPGWLESASDGCLLGAVREQDRPESATRQTSARVSLICGLPEALAAAASSSSAAALLAAFRALSSSFFRASSSYHASRAAYGRLTRIRHTIPASVPSRPGTYQYWRPRTSPPHPSLSSRCLPTFSALPSLEPPRPSGSCIAAEMALWLVRAESCIGVRIRLFAHLGRTRAQVEDRRVCRGGRVFLKSQGCGGSNGRSGRSEGVMEFEQFVLALPWPALYFNDKLVVATCNDAYAFR